MASEKAGGKRKYPRDTKRRPDMPSYVSLLPFAYYFHLYPLVYVINLFIYIYIFLIIIRTSSNSNQPQYDSNEPRNDQTTIQMNQDTNQQMHRLSNSATINHRAEPKSLQFLAYVDLSLDSFELLFDRFCPRFLRQFKVSPIPSFLPPSLPSSPHLFPSPPISFPISSPLHFFFFSLVIVKLDHANRVCKINGRAF